jgi:hypothetical protein
MNFNSQGVLPPADYKFTFAELKSSILVTGAEQGVEHWDSDWRLFLVDQLEILVKQLWEVGIADIFIDGSFVENKPHPNDIDGYFVCNVYDLPRLQRELNILDLNKIWTWDPRTRRPYRGHAKKQLPMWHQYRVELYPHYGQLCGIVDEFGHELQFPSAFRKSRNANTPKGIVQILQ